MTLMRYVTHTLLMFDSFLTRVADEKTSEREIWSKLAVATRVAALGIFSCARLNIICSARSTPPGFSVAASLYFALYSLKDTVAHLCLVLFPLVYLGC